MAYRLYVPTSAEEQKEDIFYGQISLIVARWFLIAGGLLLTIWGAKDVSEITTKFYPLIGLLILNFVLHGLYIMEQPAGIGLIWLASLLDLGIISLVIFLGLPGGKFGVENAFFIFYYPEVLAFALVFTRLITTLGILLTCAVYAVICLTAQGGLGLEGDTTLVARLVTIFATGILGTLYWRFVRERRRRALGGRGALLEELGESGSA